MEYISNALVESNLTFGSTSSAKSIGLDSNGDLNIYSQGSNILFKNGNDILLSTPQGGTLLTLDSTVHVHKPMSADYSITLKNAKYIRGTNTSGTTYDILGLGSSNSVFVGSSNIVTRLRGSSIYLGSTSTTVTSDKNLKKDFNEFDERYDTFFDNLKPTTFKYLFGTSNRTHSGFIAQEVEQALLDSNLTNQDFAAIDKIKLDTKEFENEDSKNTENSSTTYLISKGYDCEYTLRYEEFIALLVDQVQKLKTEVKELKDKLDNK